MKIANKLGIIFCLSLVTSVEAAPDKAWRISKDRWSAADEQAYSNFIQTIGESDCNTTGRCLDSTANPYRERNPDFLKSTSSDCSRFPYLLRLYFAYMNDLPFSYVSKVSAVGRSGDITQSPQGNTVVSRRAVKEGTTLRKAVSEMMAATSSGMYRVRPQEDVKGKNVFPDFYSVDLRRESIRPGTLIYDPNGHIAMVYKVDPYGRVRFIDAHPDNSITRGNYGERFARDRSALGAGLKNWRPMLYNSGGEMIGASNEQIPDFSLLQYFGTHPSQDPEWEWRQNRFVEQGVEYDFYDYLRLKLAGTKLRLDPVQETRDLMQGLCFDIQDRVDSVQEAFQNGIAAKAHPELIPGNIYGSGGEWGVYSTPSRDTRLKIAFLETQRRLTQFVLLLEQGSSRIDYSGSVAQLRVDLTNVLDEVEASCRMLYRNSRSEERTLTIKDVEERLWDLSFDPYHCPELRWGAQGAELESCPDSDLKREWYEAEFRIRTRLDRSRHLTGPALGLAELWAEARADASELPAPVDFRRAIQP